MIPTTTASPGGGGGHTTAIVLGVCLPLLLLGLLLAAGYILWRTRRRGHSLHHVLCCLRDTGSGTTRRVNGTTKFVPKTVSFLESQLSSASDSSQIRASTVFKKAQIFPLEYVDISNTLGKGAYGKVEKGYLKFLIIASVVLQVHKGFINYPDFRVEVAVKTCTRPSGLEDIEREARVFLKLKERHMNIVNLFGICIPGGDDIIPMLLLELCEVRSRYVIGNILAVLFYLNFYTFIHFPSMHCADSDTLLNVATQESFVP